MSQLLATFSFTVHVCAPVFLLIFLGIWPGHIRLLSDEFNRIASQFVFKVPLPIVVFPSSLRTDLTVVFTPVGLSHGSSELYHGPQHGKQCDIGSQ